MYTKVHVMPKSSIAMARGPGLSFGLPAASSAVCSPHLFSPSAKQRHEAKVQCHEDHYITLHSIVLIDVRSISHNVWHRVGVEQIKCLYQLHIEKSAVMVLSSLNILPTPGDFTLWLGERLSRVCLFPSHHLPPKYQTRPRRYSEPNLTIQ